MEKRRFPRYSDKIKYALDRRDGMLGVSEGQLKGERLEKKLVGLNPSEIRES